MMQSTFDHIEKFFQSKGIDFFCSICSRESFTVCGRYLIGNLLEEEKESLIPSDEVMIFVSLQCDNCGYMINFNAKHMGLIKEGEENAT